MYVVNLESLQWLLLIQAAREHEFVFQGTYKTGGHPNFKARFKMLLKFLLQFFDKDVIKGGVKI